MKDLKPLTKESFLAGAKFLVKGNIFQYTDLWLCAYIFGKCYEMYDCVVKDTSFECNHLFLGSLITKEIQFSECQLYEA